MSQPPHVIILNGVGSVGKTTVARALQQVVASPFLHVAMDAVVDMMPARLFGDPDGMAFETIQDGGRPPVAIHSGPVMAQLLRGMRHAIAAMAAQGNDLIVDDVMMGEGEGREYSELLSRYRLRLVGLFAPLDVLEQRERERRDREPGLACWQFDRVHRDLTYDLEIDTVRLTPLQAAHRIRSAFDL